RRARNPEGNALDSPKSARRKFVQSAAIAGVALVACKAQDQDVGVTPAEDLMQEHGLLQRVLLVYDEAAARIERSQSFDVALIARAANVVKRFVEEYHEQLEEQFVFPRLQAKGRHSELVQTLLKQHQRGREVTAEVLRRTALGQSPELAEAL